MSIPSTARAAVFGFNVPHLKNAYSGVVYFGTIQEVTQDFEIDSPLEFVAVHPSINSHIKNRIRLAAEGMNMVEPDNPQALHNLIMRVVQSPPRPQVAEHQVDAPIVLVGFETTPQERLLLRDDNVRLEASISDPRHVPPGTELVLVMGGSTSDQLIRIRRAFSQHRASVRSCDSLTKAVEEINNLRGPRESVLVLPARQEVASKTKEPIPAPALQVVVKSVIPPPALDARIRKIQELPLKAAGERIHFIRRNISVLAFTDPRAECRRLALLPSTTDSADSFYASLMWLLAKAGLDGEARIQARSVSTTNAVPAPPPTREVITAFQRPFAQQPRRTSPLGPAAKHLPEFVVTGTVLIPPRCEAPKVVHAGSFPPPVLDTLSVAVDPRLVRVRAVNRQDHTLGNFLRLAAKPEHLDMVPMAAAAQLKLLTDKAGYKTTVGSIYTSWRLILIEANLWQQSDQNRSKRVIIKTGSEKEDLRLRSLVRQIQRHPLPYQSGKTAEFIQKNLSVLVFENPEEEVRRLQSLSQGVEEYAMLRVTLYWMLVLTGTWDQVSEKHQLPPAAIALMQLGESSAAENRRLTAKIVELMTANSGLEDRVADLERQLRKNT